MMTQAFKMFLKAVKQQDLNLSAQVLTNILSDNTLSDFVEELRLNEETSDSFDLALRDHIAGFLDFWPVYFALRIPSHELLKNAAGEESLLEARIHTLDFVKGLVEEKDERVLLYCVDTQYASKGHYTILLPSLFERRTKLLDTFTIPFIRNEFRTRYFIGHLSSISYGQDLLDAIGVPINQLVIGENHWRLLEISLQTISIKTQERLIEYDDETWVNLIKDFSSRSTKSNSQELLQLEKLWNSLRALKSPNPESRADALRTVLDFKSLTVVPMIAPLIQQGPLFERYLVIEALTEVGGPEAESLLGDLLRDEDPVTRDKAARALAHFASRDFTTPTDSFFKDHTITDTETRIKSITDKGMKESIDYLQVLSKHRSRYVKVEVVSALSAMNSRKGNCILKDMMRDPDVVVRLEIIKATCMIEKTDAYDLLKSAMRDENLQVKLLAEKTAHTLWPEEFV